MTGWHETIDAFDHKRSQKSNDHSIILFRRRIVDVATLGVPPSSHHLTVGEYKDTEKVDLEKHLSRMPARPQPIALKMINFTIPSQTSASTITIITIDRRTLGLTPLDEPETGQLQTSHVRFRRRSISDHTQLPTMVSRILFWAGFGTSLLCVTSALSGPSRQQSTLT